MVPSIGELIQKIWNTWNIRGMIILSLLVQSFLILCAPLRKQRGGKWFVKFPLWVAYLLADWVATSTIALIMRVERSDILVFWAPFLLLHLGGPDTITSFSLGDNDFWIRHLLGLMLQVGSTIFVIFQSLPQNKLWLPTLLVLIAGIIKYVERNHAFYLASFDHFGNNWPSILQSLFFPLSISPIPVQFYQRVGGAFTYGEDDQVPIVSVAAYTFGIIKNLLVGPPMTFAQQLSFGDALHYKYSSHEVLRIIEMHLSLLYEAIHTKLPVVDSKIGYVCRVINLGCILGALVSFSILLKKYYHNKLGEFDIWLTYWLLIGALALDSISIMLLISSDWTIVAHFEKENSREFINRRRWSNSISQLNIFTCRFKSGGFPIWLKKLFDFLGISSLLETLRRIQWSSSKDFVEDQVWNFIFTTLKEKNEGKGIIHGDGGKGFAWTANKFEYVESLLMWHIATEICYSGGVPVPNNCPSTSSASASTSVADHQRHREICKLLSDYMFYLFVMEPTMMATSPNYLKIVFEGAIYHTSWNWDGIPVDEKSFRETFVKDLGELLHKKEGQVKSLKMKIETHANVVKKLPKFQQSFYDNFSRVTAACYLANELLNQSGGCPWELMAKYWVEILCYAANNCQPIVHARQVSIGGQLLTLVWLLTNYLGVTPSKDWYNVLEQKEPTDQKNKMKEPIHQFEITSATS